MNKIKVIADLHVHTISSGHAYSTLEEYVAKAKKIGLKAFAITDHGPAMPGGAHLYHFFNLRMIPKVIDGIRIFKGAELNIIDENGSLDVPDEVAREIEIVLAAMHPRVGYESMGEEKNTEVLIKAIQNPNINIIAHPGNPMYPVSVKKVVSAAKDRGIAIEINNSSFTGSRDGSWERCLEFAREIKRQNHFVSIGTDSHISMMLGNFNKAIELIAKAGLTEENILNTSMEKLEKYIKKNK